MKQLTPLQKLIKLTTYMDNGNYFAGGYREGFNITEKIKQLLEEEKQLVIDAFVQGNRELFYDGSEEVLANEYFNNKYNTK